MPKFYLSKSNSSTDQSTAQASSTDYAILLNSSQVRFFKNGTHIKNLNYGGYSQPTKSQFSGLGSEFTKFFSGDNANPVVTANTNAFAYMRANANNITNNAGLGW